MDKVKSLHALEYGAQRQIPMEDAQNAPGEAVVFALYKFQPGFYPSCSCPRRDFITCTPSWLFKEAQGSYSPQPCCNPQVWWGVGGRLCQRRRGQRDATHPIPYPFCSGKLRLRGVLDFTDRYHRLLRCDLAYRPPGCTVDERPGSLQRDGSEPASLLQWMRVANCRRCVRYQYLATPFD